MAANKVKISPSVKPVSSRERPCDACRRRKMRCLATLDPTACALCQSRSQSCTFVQDPPRKKRRVEVEDGSPDTTNSNSWQNSKPAVSGKLPIDDYSSLAGPSLLKQTLGHQNRKYISYIGMTAEYDVNILRLSPFDQKNEVVTPFGTFHRVTYEESHQQTHFLLNTDDQPEVSWEMAKLDAIEAIVAPHGPALVDIYFRIVHPSFPILHKKVFLEKHGRSYREQTPLGLIAVYILALNWWSYSLELSSIKKPDVKELEKMIPQLMSECYRRPKISDLQSGLVLLQRPEYESWTLTGQLVAMAQNLGLHDDCTEWNIPDWERGVRKRVAWALFAQDKWGALIHGRPSHIIEQNWVVRPLEAQDFPETSRDDNEEEGSAEVEKGRLVFINLISLTEILSDILDTFYTLKASKKTQSTAEALEKAKPLQIRLRLWHAELPAQLSMEVTRARKLSSNGYLHLAYFALEVTLHRAIIRSLDGNTTNEELRNITRSAAMSRLTSAITFLEQLKPQHLQSFWYFASKSNLAIIGTFGTVLWATSDSFEESESYKSHLAEYRWTLRISSNAAEFMKYAVEILDASKVFLGDFTSRKSISESVSDGKTTAKSETFQNEGRAVPQQQFSPQDLAYGRIPNGMKSIVGPYSDLDWQDFSQSTGHWFEDFDNLRGNESFQIDAQNLGIPNANAQDSSNAMPYDGGYYVG